jgi:hypothetical protein
MHGIWIIFRFYDVFLTLQQTPSTSSMLNDAYPTTSNQKYIIHNFNCHITAQNIHSSELWYFKYKNCSPSISEHKTQVTQILKYSSHIKSAIFKHLWWLSLSKVIHLKLCFWIYFRSRKPKQAAALTEEPLPAHNKSHKKLNISILFIFYHM